MHFLYTIFIALANNLDNISVRIAYSIRGIKIPIMKNLWISLITFIISTIAALSGSIISNFLSRHITSLLSMLLLTAIGLWIMLEPYFKKNYNSNEELNNSEEDKSIYAIIRKPEKADVDNSKDIDYKEATFLGIALSINNIGGGFSAGMIGLNSFFIGLFSALISFLALWIGNYITDFFNRWNLNKKATIIAGILLILIGLKQIM
ncbi:sporulation membrane protein YtaF [Thermoanaerobacterium sp. RBIITD]|uniref:sporulation membrane protein YtaF n=1 Tax=Thermoanaerobacterium sp. RBIITD TaxID=1550240 RepID=UPI000BB68769|nr:sporulation membrane protein YtaF [Thermoanaerobacterium sp. RBIITD]MDI6604516.1 sporulation membrane protein YtaF [Thermoanaerobacteraceae bacterium]SNX53727.1 putative sporulation protein YtaF [Thermoanaerobacterium sp. RBIITD]